MPSPAETLPGCVGGVRERLVERDHLIDCATYQELQVTGGVRTLPSLDDDGRLDQSGSAHDRALGLHDLENRLGVGLTEHNRHEGGGVDTDQAASPSAA